MDTTTAGLDELLAIMGKTSLQAYGYFYGENQKTLWTALREAFPAAVIGPAMSPSQVCLNLKVPSLDVSLTFDKKAVADEVRECTRTATCYVIDGEEVS